LSEKGVAAMMKTPFALSSSKAISEHPFGVAPSSSTAARARARPRRQHSDKQTKAGKSK